MNNKTEKILIIGGAGFVGSHVNKRLFELGYETIVFDNLSTGKKEAVMHGQFIEGDLGNKQDLKKLFQQGPFDAVMHFAAVTDVGESVENPSKYYHNNVVNTLNLLNAMREFKVNKLIFSSSAAIFGLPQQEKIDELHPCSPLSPYGKTKLAVEWILQDFDIAYGIKSSSLRYFNAAGGDPKGELKLHKTLEVNLIPLIIAAMQEPKEPICLFGTNYPTKDGTCVRDYIHVSDLADAHISAMERLFQGAPSSAYNLGNGNGFSVKEVIKAFEAVTGDLVPIKEGPKRPGDPAKLVADSTKAQKELNWHPQFPDLETIITHAIQLQK